jgi:hypothetical protein
MFLMHHVIDKIIRVLMMNPKAKESIQGHVIGCLKTCVLKEKWPDFESFSDHFLALSKSVLKVKGQWLRPIDVFNIFSHLVYDYVDLIGGKSENCVDGMLNCFIDDDEIKNLAESIVEYYCSVPRSVVVYAPMPFCEIELGLCEITNKINIKTFKEKSELPTKDYSSGLLGSMHNFLELGIPYFEIKTEGYPCGSVDGFLFKELLSIFKCIYQQASSYDLFINSEPKNSSFSLIDFEHKVEKYFFVCWDKTDDTITRIALPAEFCEFIHGKKFNVRIKGFDMLQEKGLSSILIERFFEKTNKVLNDNGDDSSRIKMAIEWHFNSISSKDRTMSFVQSCIGLEAIFGDEAGDQLTKTLSDRCAYLIGKNIRQRTEIRDLFKDLYKVRSKIVHGHTSSLGEDEFKLITTAQELLRLSISKEIENLG